MIVSLLGPIIKVLFTLGPTTQVTLVVMKSLPMEKFHYFQCAQVLTFNDQRRKLTDIIPQV
jgi:hypothetical protein